MAVFPDANGVFLLLLAVGCSSPRQSLLLLCLSSLLLLITHLFRLLLTRLSLPFPQTVAMLFSLGIGTALCLTLRVLLPMVPPLDPHDTAIVLLLTISGSVSAEKLADWRLLPSAVLIGGLRELLSEGTVWGISVLPLGVSPTFGDGAGGLLIAALVLWLFRFSFPLLTRGASRAMLGTVSGLSALSAAVSILTVSYPLSYCLWGVTAIGALIATCLPERYTPDGWLLFLPITILLTRDTALWWPVVIVGVAAPLILLWLGILHQRLRVTPPRECFRGVPAALTFVAVLTCIVSALPK